MCVSCVLSFCLGPILLSAVFSWPKINVRCAEWPFCMYSRVPVFNMWLSLWFVLFSNIIIRYFPYVRTEIYKHVILIFRPY